MLFCTYLTISILSFQTPLIFDIQLTNTIISDNIKSVHFKFDGIDILSVTYLRNLQPCILGTKTILGVLNAVKFDGIQIVKFLCTCKTHSNLCAISPIIFYITLNLTQSAYISLYEKLRKNNFDILSDNKQPLHPSTPPSPLYVCHAIFYYLIAFRSFSHHILLPYTHKYCSVFKITYIFFLVKEHICQQYATYLRGLTALLKINNLDFTSFGS